MHVKKGDKVVITTGKDQNQGPSTILRVLPSEGKVVVEGRNLVKKHIKGNPFLGTESRIEEVEAPIDASNVALYSEELKKGVRTQAKYVGANEELFADKAAAKASFGANAPAVISKVRQSKKTGEIFK